MKVKLKVNIRGIRGMGGVSIEKWELDKMTDEWRELVLRDLMADGDITEANIYEDPD